MSLTVFAVPALYALFVWWFSTGAIFYLDGLPRRSFPWSMAGASVFFVAAVYGLLASRADTSTTGAYMAFTSGLVVWAWLEMTYYMGYVMGPRRSACPEGCSGWRHFGHAVQASLYHELATLVLAALILAGTWRMPNQIGCWTFMVLWIMQLSAKLNVFLGVPNLGEEFLPEHLAHLKSFLNRKPMNLLFPVSVSASVVLATLLAQKAFSAAAAPFEATGFTFLGVLASLAVLEHWFLVVPLPSAALWRWSLTSRDPASAPTPGAGPPGVVHVESGDGCPGCGSARDAGPRASGVPGRHSMDDIFQRKATMGVLAEAVFLNATPADARRQG